MAQDEQSRDPAEEERLRQQTAEQETNAERARRQQQAQDRPEDRPDAERVGTAEAAARPVPRDTGILASDQNRPYAESGAMQYAKGPGGTITVAEAERRRREQMGERPASNKSPVLSGGPLEPHRPTVEGSAQDEAGFLESQRNELERAKSAAQAAGLPLIAVISIRPDDKVALYEVDDMHPNGVAFVATRTGRPVIVARTPAVEGALGRRDIKVVQTISGPED